MTKTLRVTLNRATEPGGYFDGAGAGTADGGAGGGAGATTGGGANAGATAARATTIGASAMAAGFPTLPRSASHADLTVAAVVGFPAAATPPAASAHALSATQSIADVSQFPLIGLIVSFLEPSS